MSPLSVATGTTSRLSPPQPQRSTIGARRKWAGRQIAEARPKMTQPGQSDLELIDSSYTRYNRDGFANAGCAHRRSTRAIQYC